MIAIIGGSGVYDASLFEDAVDKDLRTPYGSVRVTTGTYRGRPLVFLPRHGFSHSVPPHLINYRANIWALKMLGVTRIISTSAVGSLRKEIPPGSYVVLSNFLDFTKTRASTFYEGQASSIPETSVVHIDVTSPYCPQLRENVISAGRSLGAPIVDEGVYVCTEGPRFESASEISMYAMLGGDVIGMTNIPEVVLARELELCYCSVAMVTNFAAGISGEKLTHSEVLEIMQKNISSIRSLLARVISTLPEKRQCPCQTLLQGAKG